MRFAASMVAFVSLAMSGDTSIETQPSIPRVRSNSGRNRSAARRKSSSASSTNKVSPDKPPRAFCRMLWSYREEPPMASSKIVGLEVSPVTDSSSM